MLKLLADRTHDELRSIFRNPDSITGAVQKRALNLAKIVHALHSYLRYLQASDPLRTPPGVQQAIALLVEKHGKRALQCDVSDINVLVRPQWTYNLKYIDILHQFEYEAACELAFALDPERRLGASDVLTLLEALNKEANRQSESKPEDELLLRLPKHVAVLSFAGLDRDDVLLYPLLAHELGHFLDFALEDLGRQSTDSIADRFLPTAKQLENAGTGLDDSDFFEDFRVCLREFTADLIAARIAGLSYFFAFSEFFKTLTTWPGQLINRETAYPGFGLRSKLIWDELVDRNAGIQAVQALRANLKTWRLDGKATLLEYLSTSENRIQKVATNLDLGSQRQNLMLRCVRKAIPAIQALARQVVPNPEAAQLSHDIQDMIGLLADQVPPFQSPTRDLRANRDYNSWSFHEVLTAGWVYQIAIGEARERILATSEESCREYQNTCLLLQKALELDGSRSAIDAIEAKNKSKRFVRRPISNRQTGAGVISGPSLCRALNRKKSRDRLVLCPDFGDSAIESASRDLHLGHWFRVSRRTSLTTIDIAYKEQRAAARRQGQTEVFVPPGGEFVLQQGDFALAASLEYLCLPPDIMAFVEGKSSLGRAGLLIATATQVAPGFKGCIVLELYNAGTVPVILRPAMRVAQLVLVSTDRKLPDDWLYSGEFQVQIRP